MFYGLCLNKATAVDESQCHWSPLLPRQQVFLLQAAYWLSNSFKYIIKAREGEIKTICRREAGELTFITRVQWLSLRGLNNQYVKLSGYALTPTTHLQTPGCFFIGGGNAERQQCQEPRQGDELYTLEICYTFSWHHQTCTFTAVSFFFFLKGKCYHNHTERRVNCKWAH